MRPVASILRDMLASGDDAELHVYADWLEEQGHVEHAQLLHLQCEQARLGRWERRHRELGWEIDALIREHGERLRAELPALDGVTWTTFERGLVIGARVDDLATLYRHADTLAKLGTISRVDVANVGAHEHVALPWLDVLRLGHCLHGHVVSPELLSTPAELELYGSPFDPLEWLVRDQTPLQRLVLEGTSQIGDAFVTRLAAAPWAQGLAELSMPTGYQDDDSGYAVDPTLGADGAKTLTKLGKLQRLNVDRQQIGAGVSQLMKLRRLRDLSARDDRIKKLDFLASATGTPFERLDLSKNMIGSAGARAIATCPRLAHLQYLALDTCELASEGIDHLVRSPLWHTLRYLDLSRNPLGAATIRALAAAEPPAQLHTLLLADADLDDDAGNLLGKIAWLGNLCVLDISGNRLGRGAIGLRQLEPEALRRLSVSAIAMERSEAVALSRFWPRLVELEARNNQITDAGLDRFVSAKESSLQLLDLRHCGLGDDGLDLLIQRAQCPRLHTLDLGENTFTVPALERLLAAPIAQRLDTLRLQSCGLADQTARLFATATLPPTLRELDLQGNNLTEDGLLALADSPSLHSVHVKLARNPYRLSDKTTTRLVERFGSGWFYDA